MIGIAFLGGGFAIALVIAVWYIFRVVDQRDNLERENRRLREEGRSRGPGV